MSEPRFYVSRLEGYMIRPRAAASHHPPNLFLAVHDRAYCHETVWTSGPIPRNRRALMGARARRIAARLNRAVAEETAAPYEREELAA